MHAQLLAQSPLLILPLVAMFLFIAVWATASVRVMTRSRNEMDEAARLPLENDHESR
ncbi:MAG TPA: hypothetical protein VGL81_24205 [Polyangiaceae bacterium]|jgi:cbb3-type cytochrome oxidase subunit 3